MLELCPADRAPSPRADVLIVDDDHHVRRLFARVLTRVGFRVREAADGASALSEIGRHPTDVVVLDARMPVLDGIGVVSSLRATPATRTLPVIMVTADSDVQERVRGLEAGADDYLTKPAHPEELVARVRALLRGKEAWREALDSMLNRRLELVERLGELDRDAGTPLDAITAACSLLATLPGVAAAGVVAFEDGGARTVASDGFPAVALGEPEQPLVATRLRRRAKEGPWIDDLQPRPARSHGAAVAYAPLTSHGRLVGVLALGADPALATATGPHVDPTLATAIDVAPVLASMVNALLASADVVDLRRVIERTIAEQRFSVVAQPIIRLADGVTVGFEALARFDDLTPPDQRFEQAARVGLATQLERAVLGAVAEASPSLPADCFLSVNVSPTALLDPETRAVLRRIQGRALVVELTERERIDDYDAILAAYADIPAARRCVDDAGAGYASLRHICALHPHFIKLDLSWVRNLDRDPARQALVAGLVHFAGLTDATVIAEGIEDEAEATAVAALGVDLGQGFLLGEPAAMSPERYGSSR